MVSALPFINALNACCCLWFVVGGLIASYSLQQEQPTPITPGDGAMVGLLAGVFGSVVSALLSIPVGLVTGPMSRAMVQQALETGDLPPNVRAMLESLPQDEGGLAARLFARIALFVLFLFVGGFFATLGGLLGAVIFSRKSTAMPRPPADPRFS